MTTENNASRKSLAQVFEQLNTIVLGKEDQIKMAVTCLLAGGHLLIEDLPGLGKTVLAHALGLTLGLAYQRVQFTSDLLPGDIIGTSIYDRNTGSFSFTQGPVFTQLLLADEINRATPKCQSALLEAMEERQVSVDGTPRRLDRPFFVIATQNPNEQLGTFPLPESQLDRFLLRISMGYPGREAELSVLAGEDRRQMLDHTDPILSREDLICLQDQVGQVHAGNAVLEYLRRILEFTRNSEVFQSGLSTRAGLGLLQASRAWALIHDRDMVLPGDIQAVLPAAAGHRLVTSAGRMDAVMTAREIIESVGVE